MLCTHFATSSSKVDHVSRIAVITSVRSSSKCSVLHARLRWTTALPTSSLNTSTSCPSSSSRFVHEAGGASSACTNTVQVESYGFVDHASGLRSPNISTACGSGAVITTPAASH